MNCPTCKTPMKPLAFSEYCPNDCDKLDDLDKQPSLAFDDEPTQPFTRPLDIELPVSVARCPKCGSSATAYFDPDLEHCWDCGSVWQYRHKP